jgi:hypothetical protein
MRRFLGIFFFLELPPKCEFESSDALNADILFSVVSLIYCVDSWCLEFRSVCEREHGAFRWDGTVGGNRVHSMCFLFSNYSVSEMIY